MLVTISTYFIWFIIYSMFGWVMETVVCSISAKKYVNRGFLNGPYCPIYGFGILSAVILLGNVQNIVLLFVASFAIICLLEYFTSWLMEVLFKARWWDYSGRPFNINGRVWLPNAIIFCVLGVFILKVIHPLVANFTSVIPEKAIPYVALGLLVCFLTDIVYTLIRFSKFNKKIALPPPEVYQKINSQERRMVKAYPRLSVKKYEETLQEVRRQAMERRKRLKKKRARRGSGSGKK